MDLEDLKKKLYSKDSAMPEGRPQHANGFGAPEEANPSGNVLPPQWLPEEQTVSFSAGKKKKIIWLGVAGAVFILLTLGIWFYWTYNSFNRSNISLDIFGQERIASGEEIKYVVRYKNNSRVALENASLTFFYSENSLPSAENTVKIGGLTATVVNLGKIAPGGENQAEFDVRVLGDRNSQHKFSAKLSYRPAGIKSDFANEAEFVSTVVSVPLVLNFDLPDKIVSGQKINFSLKYLNASDTIFKDSKIKIDFPDGFVFNVAQPSPDENNNIWSISEIGVREEGKIMISGILNGAENENKVFKASIGLEKDGAFLAYAQYTASPIISASPLFIEQSLSGVDSQAVTAGQAVTYNIKYRNTTNESIGPIVIMTKIESRAVDLATVKAGQDQGFFDSGSGVITWNEASLPGLKMMQPNEEKVISFSLKVKDHLPINRFSDKNFTIVTTSTIDSPNVPLSLRGTQLKGQNQLTVKINSNLVLSAKGYFVDSIIVNSGPLPPSVGQKTTYTIYWQVLNSSNDLSDVSVEGYLPSYVQWENKITPVGEDIKYDATTGKIVWKIGRLAAEIGILLPVRQVAFQVGLVPSLGQVGQSVEVIKSAKIVGKDSFTGTDLSLTVNAIKSDMPDDPTIGYEKGRVTQ